MQDELTVFPKADAKQLHFLGCLKTGHELVGTAILALQALVFILIPAIATTKPRVACGYL